MTRADPFPFAPCRYDSGRDGYIDLMELKLMMEKLGAPQTHLGLKNMIKEVDEDFDGKLSFREVRVAAGAGSDVAAGRREEAARPCTLAVGSTVPSVFLHLWGAVEKQVSFPMPQGARGVGQCQHWCPCGSSGT